MRKMIVLAAVTGLLAGAAGCKVEKKGEDTYEVVTPTPEAKEGARKVTEEAKELGAVAGEKAQEAGTELKQEIHERTAPDTSGTGSSTTVKTETNATSTSTTATQTTTRKP